jgi:hypothetical protein
MNEDQEFLRGVLLSVNRALIGEIIPSIRKITVVCSKKLITITVYSDCDLSNKDKDDFDSSVVSQVIADYPYPEKGEPRVELIFIRCDMPNEIVDQGLTVYARKEYQKQKTKKN